MAIDIRQPTIADSDILIDFLRGYGPIRDGLAPGLARRLVATTTISHFELLGGVAALPDIEAAILLLARCRPLPLDDRAAAYAANVDRELRAQGLRLQTADTLVAGIALAHGLPLLTRNLRHFDRVPGLLLEPF